ncbi:PAS domain-containing protein [Acidisoma silvae]|uniref:PAS domain-containing protein n=1 Tax=Acidisoma silvae TaxID=2802396 RepID=A0A964E013_9PROT|nr:PAS domain-containing protein [Acidisoma silvae]MCB8876674.1 hypothetical protein [Acidisoma silvae]
MSLAKFFRRMGVVIMWLTSAYVVFTILIALTEQGRPTSQIFATNIGELFYPEWYASPLVIAAVKIAVLAYPAAALAYGIGTLLAFGRNDRAAVTAGPAAALPLQGPMGFGARPALASALPPAWSNFDLLPPEAAASAPVPRAEDDDNLCILDMALFIRAVSRNAAAVLGLPPSALQRRPFTNFVSAADIGQLHATWDRLLSDPQAVIPLQLHMRHAGDVMVDVEAICRAGLGADGRIISMTLRTLAKH